MLVPTKKLTQAVSDIFRESPAGMTENRHTASVDTDAAILGAHVIAFLMQSDTGGHHFALFVDLLCDYFQGKVEMTSQRETCKPARTFATHSTISSRQAAGKSIRGNSILVNVLAVYTTVKALTLSRDPDKDWLAVRRVVKDSTCERLRNGRLIDDVNL
jgi:DNA helicase-2/ATP-dependent DNA helicase PcrA